MGKKIFINGKAVSEQKLMEIKPGDTVFVCDDTPVGNPPQEAATQIEGKTTLKERIAALPWWKKAAAVVGAVAGGAYIASKFAPTVEDEDEEPDEDEEEEE